MPSHSSSSRSNSNSNSNSTRKSMEAKLDRLTRDLAQCRLQKEQYVQKLESLHKTSSSSGNNKMGKESLRRTIQQLQDNLRRSQQTHALVERQWIQHQKEMEDMDNNSRDSSTSRREDSHPLHSGKAAQAFMAEWDPFPASAMGGESTSSSNHRGGHGTGERTPIDKDGFPMSIPLSSSTSNNRSGYNTATTSEDDYDYGEDDDDEYCSEMDLSVSLVGGDNDTVITEHTKDSIHLYKNARARLLRNNVNAGGSMMSLTSSSSMHSGTSRQPHHMPPVLGVVGTGTGGGNLGSFLEKERQSSKSPPRSRDASGYTTNLKRGGGLHSHHLPSE